MALRPDEALPLHRVDRAVGFLALTVPAVWLLAATSLIQLFAQGAINAIPLLAIIAGTTSLVVAGARLLRKASKGRVAFPLALACFAAAYFLLPFVYAWIKLPCLVVALGGVFNAFRPTGTPSST
jgi:hypothetical protein